MTKQEYEKRMEENFKSTAAIAVQGDSSAFELFNDAMRLKVLNDLEIDKLSIEIAYLKSRVEALEQLADTQKREKT